ncbi:MAG: putative RDD family membrane protein YckC [Oleispira sp.]|jgi:uncharacterized RDD family membrane protein YckC
MSDINLPSAPLWRRLAALVYDLFNVTGISFLLAAILIPASSHLFNHGEPIGELPVPIAASYFFIIIFFFYTTFWRLKKQTLGMKAWGLSIANELKPQQRLSMGQCMLRIAIGFFSIGLAGFGFWWALWDKQEKTWHDHASFTRIVFDPRSNE